MLFDRQTAVGLLVVVLIAGMGFVFLLAGLVGSGNFNALEREGDPDITVPGPLDPGNDHQLHRETVSSTRRDSGRAST